MLYALSDPTGLLTRYNLLNSLIGGLMTLEEQLADVSVNLGGFKRALEVCKYIRSTTTTCMTFNSDFDCEGCIGLIQLSSLREIEPELTESNFKDTIRIHVVLRG